MSCTSVKKNLNRSSLWMPHKVCGCFWTAAWTPGRKKQYSMIREVVRENNFCVYLVINWGIKCQAGVAPKPPTQTNSSEETPEGQACSSAAQTPACKCKVLSSIPDTPQNRKPQRMGVPEPQCSPGEAEMREGRSRMPEEVAWQQWSMLL